MRAHILIHSGEGTGPAHVDIYAGTLTARALMSRLTRERCAGARWASCSTSDGAASGPEACIAHVARLAAIEVQS